ncbi:hypothetical protein GH714_035719 [Hevea brasiliensis]|uniref:Tf2-1-like SH3-like domain-containing protein n=1 Tax=Hevea brasiliensis TaxID=3981 RepID=A0A6A6NCM3_HEVBR|nr:hypothetical protein GH714_035719 [Hevea brasiliensis]
MGDSNDLRAIRESQEQNAGRVTQVEAQLQELTRQLREFMSNINGSHGKGSKSGIGSSNSRLNGSLGSDDRSESRQGGAKVPRYAKLNFPMFDGSDDPFNCKLFNFDFRVEYKAGQLNKVADALSRRDEEIGNLFAISQPMVLLLDDIRSEIKNTDSLCQLRRQVEDGELGADWSVSNGLILYCHRIYLQSTSPLIHTIIGGVVYGREPPKLLSYDSGSRVDAVDKALVDRDSVLEEIRLRLQQAQVRMKEYYDKGHRELQFQSSDWVWLRLLPYRRLSITNTQHTKLSPKFYGTYKVLRRISEVVYQIELPSSSRLHDGFHISLLRPFKGAPPSVVPSLPLVPIPAVVLRERLNQGTWELLVQWKGLPPSEAT